MCHDPFALIDPFEPVILAAEGYLNRPSGHVYPERTLPADSVVLLHGGSYTAEGLLLVAAMLQHNPAVPIYICAKTGTYSVHEAVATQEAEAEILGKLLWTHGCSNSMVINAIAANTPEEVRYGSMLRASYSAIIAICADNHARRVWRTWRWGVTLLSPKRHYADPPNVQRIVEEVVRLDEYRHGSIAQNTPYEDVLLDKYLRYIRSCWPDAWRVAAFATPVLRHRMARYGGADPLANA